MNGLKKNIFPASLWLSLGETLFHTREYEKCIYYIQKGLDNWKDTAALADYHRMRLFQYHWPGLPATWGN